MVYELVPRYNSRKSFYWKAQVQETENKNVKDYRLYSYGTLVAKIKKNGDKTKYTYLGHYSSTTTSHQKEFFKQQGLNDKQIKELFSKGEIII